MTRLLTESTRTEPCRDHAEPSCGRVLYRRVKGLQTTSDLLESEEGESAQRYKRPREEAEAIGCAEGKGRKEREKWSHFLSIGSKRWRMGDGERRWWRCGGRRASRGKGEVVARRCVNEGDDSVVLSVLETERQTMTCRREIREKIWWIISCGSCEKMLSISTAAESSGADRNRVQTQIKNTLSNSNKKQVGIKLYQNA